MLNSGRNDMDTIVRMGVHPAAARRCSTKCCSNTTPIICKICGIIRVTTALHPAFTNMVYLGTAGIQNRPRDQEFGVIGLRCNSAVAKAGTRLT